MSLVELPWCRCQHWMSGHVLDAISILSSACPNPSAYWRISFLVRWISYACSMQAASNFTKGSLQGELGETFLICRKLNSLGEKCAIDMLGDHSNMMSRKYRNLFAIGIFGQLLPVHVMFTQYINTIVWFLADSPPSPQCGRRVNVPYSFFTQNIHQLVIKRRLKHILQNEKTRTCDKTAFFPSGIWQMRERENLISHSLIPRKRQSAADRVHLVWIIWDLLCKIFLTLQCTHLSVCVRTTMDYSFIYSVPCKPYCAYVCTP